MREIKFRAWDGEEMYVPEIQPDEEGCPINEWFGSFKNVTLMQYTGLKDKNGKEIYEGDIVKSFWQYDGVTVRDYELTGLIVWNQEVAAFSLDYGDQMIKWLSSYEREELLELEIIGNVHQNPEFFK